MSLFSNYPLWSALSAIVMAQVIKIPLAYFTSGKLDWKMLFSTGGMPSSHSAAVTALTTAIGLIHGAGSSEFAICVIFSVIVMFDAVRRHAGMHATVLNLLIEDFHKLIQEMKSQHTLKPNKQMAIKLKELLGHQPSEVLIGGWLGIIQSALLFYLFEYTWK
jgi:acid phosphatase family membrane protein YuiD